MTATLLNGRTNGHRLTTPSELRPDELAEILAYGETYDAKPLLPTTRADVEELRALLKDDDDTNGLPGGIPTRRYWPEAKALDCDLSIIPTGTSSNSLVTFRGLWRNRLVKINPYCRWCARRIGKANRTLEHIIPLCRGGLDHALNYAAVCDVCNQRKSDLTPTEMVECIMTGFVPREVAEARIKRDLLQHRRIKDAETIRVAQQKGGAS